MGFAWISTDLYLPAMPAMSSSLGAKPGQVELTVSGYLIGFSVGQLLWGPVGDRHGRRFPIAIGLVFFIVGSAGCAIAGSVEAMIAGRVVQAAGACAGVVLARAMVRGGNYACLLRASKQIAKIFEVQLERVWP
jgi:MFS transporter, DHA1 family, multidrug resistance protein